MADQIQRLIDRLIADLEGLLTGPYLDILRIGLAGAQTDAGRLAAVQTAQARLQRNLPALLKAASVASGAGVPVDAWPVVSLRLYDRLLMLLRGLIALRALESMFDGYVKDWCE